MDFLVFCGLGSALARDMNVGQCGISYCRRPQWTKPARCKLVVISRIGVVFRVCGRIKNLELFTFVERFRVVSGTWHGSHRHLLEFIEMGAKY